MDELQVKLTSTDCATEIDKVEFNASHLQIISPLPREFMKCTITVFQSRIIHSNPNNNCMIHSS